MNRQPYATPPRWWSPCLSSKWCRLWTPFRRRRAWKEHGLAEIELQGVEHLRRAVDAGFGVLIAPNHPTHADPFVLTEASARLGMPFYYMTAWQVFAKTHALGRRVLRQHGCFSINREGHDLRAYRQAVRILQGSNPLVIFPEGEVLHLNDQASPFRLGAATAALRAARRSNRPVACLPCGLKYQYIDDPMPELARVMTRLEHGTGLSPMPDSNLVRRVERLAARVLRSKESEYLGRRGEGSAQARTETLETTILTRLEREYGVTRPRNTVPERVKELRRLAILRSDENPGQTTTVRRDLDDLFFVMQLYSYPTDYLDGRPSVERLAETVDKLEEDILQMPTAGLRGRRRVTVVFGEPILAEPNGNVTAAEITTGLRARVQSLLNDENGLNSVEPPPASFALPTVPVLNPAAA